MINVNNGMKIIRKKKGRVIFKLQSRYKPIGDQPKAIEYLSNGIKEELQLT